MPNKRRKCKYHDKFIETWIKTPIGVFCSYESASAYGREKAEEKRVKVKAKQDKAVKKANARQKREYYDKDTKTRREAAERACNGYILLRDHGKPCISCGAGWDSGVKFSAGHYITAGSCTALRFDERNIYGQCWWNCNKNKSGNIVEARKGIIQRTGQEVIDFLEGPQPIINITVEFYKEIEEHFKAKSKQIKQNNLP